MNQKRYPRVEDAIDRLFSVGIGRMRPEGPLPNSYTAIITTQKQFLEISEPPYCYKLPETMNQCARSKHMPLEFEKFSYLIVFPYSLLLLLSIMVIAGGIINMFFKNVHKLLAV